MSRSFSFVGRLVFGAIFFLIGCFINSARAGMSLVEGDQIKCLALQSDFEGYIVDGRVARGRVGSTLDYFYVTVEQGDSSVRAPLAIVDMNKDGLYEVMRLFDAMGSDGYGTNVLLLASLDTVRVEDLFMSRRRSKYYSEFLAQLSSKGRWLSTGRVVGVEPLNFSGVYFRGGSPEVYLTSILKIHEDTYFVVEHKIGNATYVAFAYPANKDFTEIYSACIFSITK